MNRRVHPLTALALAAVVATLAACSSGATPAASSGASSGASASPTVAPSAATSPSAGGSASAAPSPSPATVTKLTVGLGYIPSVQFAQFYYAQQKGYYRDAGLDVTFQNAIDADLIRKTGLGSVDISLADGTSVIPAVSQGIPVVYVATIYAAFPNVVFAKASSGITTAADLKGKKIGIPGRYGSGWIMLQALLSSAGLSPSDVTIVEYPDFGQLAGVQQGAVDAATGFANNEPIRLEASGETAVVLTVDQIVPLPGNGLIVGRSTLTSKHDALTAFVAATLRAMSEIAADPAAGWDASVAAVPELASDPNTPVDLQKQTLVATAGMWTAAAPAPLGAIDPADWTASVEYLSGLPDGLVPNPVTVDQLVSTELLPK